jgi:hypothetical protein
MTPSNIVHVPAVWPAVSGGWEFFMLSELFVARVCDRFSYQAKSVGMGM